MPSFGNNVEKQDKLELDSKRKKNIFFIDFLNFMGTTNFWKNNIGKKRGNYFFVKCECIELDFRWMLFLFDFKRASKLSSLFNALFISLWM